MYGLQSGVGRRANAEFARGIKSRTIQTDGSEETNPSLAPQCQALLRLCRTAESLTISLDKELRVSQAPVVRPVSG